jgi:hypothetical protein
MIKYFIIGFAICILVWLSYTFANIQLKECCERSNGTYQEYHSFINTYGVCLFPDGFLSSECDEIDVVHYQKLLEGYNETKTKP